MATCPDKKYRNTELALSAAKKAVELEGEPTIRGLDTLATAYAASGKVTEATAGGGGGEVKWRRQAEVQLANTEKEHLKKKSHDGYLPTDKQAYVCNHSLVKIKCRQM